MQGKSNKISKFGLALKAAQGDAPAANPQVSWYLADSPSGGILREETRLPATDSSTDRGPLVVTKLGWDATIPIYVQKGGAALPLYGAMGAVAHSGAGPYTHTTTLAEQLPWFDAYWMREDDVIEIVQDVQFASLGMSIANGALKLDMHLLGLDVTEESAITFAPINYRDAETLGLLQREGAGNLKIDTVAQKLENVSLMIDNKLEARWAEDSKAYGIFRNGEREISGTYEVIYQSKTAFPNYQGHYFDGSGNLSTVIDNKAIDWSWVRDATKNSLGFVAPQCPFSEIAIQVGTDGSTTVISGNFDVDVPDSGQMLTAVVKDETATF